MCDGDLPEDVNGHGIHVAATAVGSHLNEATALPPLEVPGSFNEISGVAPCAHVRSYKVCPGSQCPGADIVAGLQSVLLHGDVDVANFSIGGGKNPWSDGDRIKLDLVDGGTFVAAAAGNDGPDPSTVSHLGPWVATVANSTHDVNTNGTPRQGDQIVESSSRGPTLPPHEHIQKPDMIAPGFQIWAADTQYRMSASGPGQSPPATQDIELNPGSHTRLKTPGFDHRALRRDSAQDPAAEGCNGFPENFFAGAAAFARRGGCPDLDKIVHAYEAGADFIILSNWPPATGSLLTRHQPSGIEAFAVSQEAGQEISNWLETHDNEIQFDFVIEPAYGFKTGTSMASPHVAGAATLVRQARPDWTVMEVQSALRMTAERTGFFWDGATVWDVDGVGSGRVELARAALAGLVMEESHATFLAANPATGGDTRTLNLPALRDVDCSPDCTFTRIVRNTNDVPTTWSAEGFSRHNDFSVSVNPSTFSFSGDLNETVTLTVTVTPEASVPHWSVTEGELVLTENQGLSPDLHWTIAASWPQSCDTSLTPKDSINDAVTSAEVGSTICLADGIYQETVDIDRSGITLAAVAGVSPVLDGSELDGQNTGIRIFQANDVRIEGLTVRNFEHFGIQVQSSTSGVSILNNLIENNGIVNPVESGGVAAYGSDMLIHSNTIRDNLHSGIRGGGDAIISSNLIEGSMRGITSTGGSPEILDNTFRANDDGIRTFVPPSSPPIISNALVSDNLFENNEGRAILFSAEDSVFEGNLFTGNGSDLILTHAHDLIISHNQFEHGLNLLRLPADESDQFLHQVIDNTTAGRPLVYLRDISAPSIDSEAGQIILANVSNAEVSGFDRSEFVDLLIAHSDNVLVQDNRGIDVYTREVSGVVIHNNLFESLPAQTILEERFRRTGDLVVSDNTWLVPEAEAFFLRQTEQPVNVTGNTIIGAGTHGIRLGIGFPVAMEVTISGNTIENSSGWGIHLRGAEGPQLLANHITGGGEHAILVYESDNVVIQNNTVAVPGGGAIRIENGSSDIQIDGNEIDGMPTVNTLCVLVADDTSGSVEVTANTVSNCGNSGISVRAANALVAGNTVSDSRNHGIDIRDASGILVRDNVATNNGRLIAGMRFGSGIHVWSAPESLVRGNLVENNVRSGIVVRRSSHATELIGNAIRNHNEFGIEAMGDQGTNDLFMGGNVITGNSLGVFVEAGVVDTVLRNNEIAGNSAGMVAEQDLVDARENAWGHVSGPSGGVADPVTGTMAQGSGDSVSEHVLFDPWIGETLPEVLSVTPDSGPMSGGTELTISGNHFSAQAMVSIGEVVCGMVHVTVPNSLTCTTNEVFEPGPRDVIVTNPDGTSATLPDGFTYLPDAAPAPVLFWIDPHDGPESGGTLLVIEGDAIQSGATVTVGGQPCTILFDANPFQIGCEVPPGAAGSATVALTNPDDQSAALIDAFTYQAISGDGPELDAVTPTTVLDSGGAELTLSGDHFTPTGTIRLGIAPCLDRQFINAQTLTCNTPALPAGSIDVRVRNADGQFAVLSNALQVNPSGDSIFWGNFTAPPSSALLVARQAFGPQDVVRLLARNTSDGEPLWAMSTDQPLLLKSVATRPEGDSWWALGDGKVMKLDADGDVEWVFDDYTNTNEHVAVDADGYAYVSYINGFVRKLDPDGHEVTDNHWPFEYASGWAWSIALDSGGRLFLAGHDGALRRLEPDGSEYTGDSWPYTGHDDRLLDVAVDAQGRLFTASWDGTVRKISPEGDEVWVYDGHDGVVRTIAVTAEGRVFSGSSEPAVRVLQSDGSEVTDGGWPRLDFPSHSDQVYSLAVDVEGRVFVGTDSSHVIALSPIGQLLWQDFLYLHSLVDSLAVEPGLPGAFPEAH